MTKLNDMRDIIGKVSDEWNRNFQNMSTSPRGWYLWYLETAPDQPGDLVIARDNPGGYSVACKVNCNTDLDGNIGQMAHILGTLPVLYVADW